MFVSIYDISPLPFHSLTHPLPRPHFVPLFYFYDGSAFLIFLSVYYLSPFLITSFFLFLSSSLSFYTLCFSKFHVSMTFSPHVPSLCRLHRQHHLLFYALTHHPLLRSILSYPPADTSLYFLLKPFSHLLPFLLSPLGQASETTYASLYSLGDGLSGRDTR